MQSGKPSFLSRGGWLVAFAIFAWSAQSGALAAMSGLPEATTVRAAVETAIAAPAAPADLGAVEPGAAEAAGEPVVWLAAAPAQGDKKGKVCKYDRACGEGRYCAKAVGDCTGYGRCVARPDVCPQFVFPVCGCNGKTFNNECWAATAGVNVRHTGDCPR